MAAVLYCGPNAVLSHLDAGALWGFCFESSSRTHVTTTDRGRRSRPGVVVQRVHELIPEERTERDGIPVTSAARTLLDLAEVLDEHRLERAIEEAERLGLFDLRAVAAVRARARGRRGLKPLPSRSPPARWPPSASRNASRRWWPRSSRSAYSSSRA